MKKLVSIIALSTAMGAANALEPLELPGSHWAVGLAPSGVSGPDKDAYLLQGRLEQGAIWARFGDSKEWALNTYLSFAYSVDNEGLPYNNKVVPGVGVKMTRTFSNGVLDIGVQYVYENRWKALDDKTGSGIQAFISVWNGWDLKK